MSFKNNLKATIVQSGWTMTRIVEELNKRHGRCNTVQNFSSKLNRESLKYTEVEEILSIIGYEISWNKVSSGFH